MTAKAKELYDLDAAFVAQFGNIDRELVVPTRSMIPTDYVGLPIRVDPHCPPDCMYVNRVEWPGGEAPHPAR